MDQPTILFLGDSTSMTVGLERTMHPFLSAAKHSWPEGTRFVSCCLPGITAADAVMFYFRHKKQIGKSLRAVVIYLGNCDTASTEVVKGRVGSWKRAAFKLRESIGKAPGKTSIKNRLLHFEWNNTYDPYIESPESAEDYEANIAEIISDCNAHDVPVVLVRPKANFFFPAGTGKGNFIFYRYFGLKEKIATQLTIADARFKRALELQEEERFDDAATAYNEILINPPSTSMSGEYALLVLNNYAVAKAEAGRFEEAVYLLQLLRKERDSRKEIVLYNLAYVFKAMGNEVDFLNTLVASYEADSSLFRVRAPYVYAVDRLAAAHKVHLIDMHTLVDDELYLDHCHPLKSGQVILSDAICAALAEAGIRGSATASIENILYNPELGSGNISFFHDYFKTFAPFSEGEIAQQVRNLQQLCETQSDEQVLAAASLTRELRTAVEYYLKHPCFTSLRDIIQTPPVRPIDIGRFPEYFLVRHIIPYLRMFEADELLQKWFDPSLCLLRSAAALSSILPAAGLSQAEPQLIIDEIYEYEHVPAMIEKIKNLLREHLLQGNQVYKRTKSTIFWYVRETLRFGSHSRYSMRYDRILMEFLAEGLAVAALLDAQLKLGHAAKIRRLIGVLEETVKVHDRYCSGFSLRRNNDALLHAYDEALKQVLATLE